MEHLSSQELMDFALFRTTALNSMLSTQKSPKIAPSRRDFDAVKKFQGYGKQLEVKED